MTRRGRRGRRRRRASRRSARQAQSLADAIRAETRSVAIHARSERAPIASTSSGSREVLAESPGACPVQLVIQLDDGAEAVLALGRAPRSSPTTRCSRGLEKLFGEKVAELR